MSDFSQDNQNIRGDQTNIGGNQIIQQIVLVGQILDLAQARNLLPKLDNLFDVSSVSEAFNREFIQRPTGDLSEAVAEVGKMLGPVLAKWKPKDRFFAVPLDAVLSDLLKDITQYFLERNYWKTYSKLLIINDDDRDDDGDKDYIKCISLDTTNLLFKNRLDEDVSFGIGLDEDGASGFYENIDTDDPYWTPASAYKYEQQQLLLVGIILDMIRLCSTTGSHTEFWFGIANMLNANSEDVEKGEE